MNKLPLKIGITGGIGSGKSVVCKIFNSLGVPVYDADTRAKWVMTNDAVLQVALIKQFGEEVFEKGELNRSYLASIVFKNKEKLKILNKLVHPRVGKDFHDWVVDHANHPYLLKEAALLYESNAYQQLDKIIVVSSPEELRISRVLARDSQRSKEEIQGIIEKQMPDEKKIALADYVIINNETELLIHQVLDLHQKFILTNSH
ncbi:MAG: dephospho-CoA kinase [Cyclobacteriaceae bacterium]|nr:dephospho-CoA kinase [Cyclobacteriaceae bacterium]